MPRRAVSSSNSLVNVSINANTCNLHSAYIYPRGRHLQYIKAVICFRQLRFTPPPMALRPTVYQYAVSALGLLTIRISYGKSVIGYL